MYATGCIKGANTNKFKIENVLFVCLTKQMIVFRGPKLM